jgi:FAD/FMN-containing dehydrogenase
MDRREFLRSAGRTTLGVAGLSMLGAACTPAGARRAPAASTAFDGPPADGDWSAFGRSLAGKLIRPGDPAYPTAKQLFDPRFDYLHPAAIAECRSASDVQQSIQFARNHGLPFTARSGGHSYAGYSSGSGLVCDVGHLSSVSVNAAAKTATIGAGARLVDIYAVLAQHGLAFAGGSCPTVGISGLTLGGGQGVLGRKFGLASDNLRSLKIVTAAGDLLTCDATHNSDLFWACRGGGGGNFGVVTSFTFAVHPVTTLSRFFLSWPWSHASDVLHAWQSWAPNRPDALWSTCHLHAAVGQPGVSVSGVYVGPQSGLSAQLPSLINAVGAQPTTKQIASDSVAETMMVEAGCSDLTVAECHLPTQNQAGKLSRQIEKAKSDFFGHVLPPAGVQAVVDAIDARLHDPALQTGGGVLIDAYGGALNRPAQDATAFVHRDQLFLAQYFTTWSTSTAKSTVNATLKWLSDFAHTMRPYASGQAYQNYIDPDRGDWEHAYYGSNLSRLRHVKSTYDPHGFFHFRQSIPPA